jgi:enoyl-CoA hydratase
MELERHDDVTVVRMRGGKGNAMDARLLSSLIALLREAESAGAKAIVVTGDKQFFSAGLALPSIYDLDRPAMRAFIDLFGEAMLQVLRCEVPVVAAVNGHAIAGGCVLALQCDVRVAAAEGKIGLNEVQLGIGLPAVVVESLRLRVPPTALVQIAVEGTLFTPAEARALGIVDEVVAADAVLPRALERARALAALPGLALAQVRTALRRPALEAIAAHGDADRERWLDTWFSPPARQRIGEVVARLAAR